MYIKDVSQIKEFVAGDNCFIKEVLSPLKDPVDIRFSMARAVVKPGEITYKHTLESIEIYYILKGKGTAYVGDETAHVREGHVIYIPAGSVQQIKNAGDENLEFLCFVDPPWEKKNETVLE